MDRQRTIGCIFLVLALLAPTDRVFGGKLNRVRSAAKASPKHARARRAANSPPSDSRKTEKDQSDHKASDDHGHRTQVVATTAKPRQSSRKAGKLNEIRGAAKRHEQARPVKQKQSKHREAPRHSKHRPSYSPSRSHLSRRRGHPNNAAIGFYSHYSSPVYLPTVIEEHHYYEPQPVVVAGCPVAPAPLPAQVVPPIVPVSPPIEYATETIVVDEDPFEYLSPVQIRFEIDYATDESDLSRSGFGLLVNATGGFGVDTGVRMFRESGDEFRDHLWLGDFNVVYELFPTSFSRTRAGVGVNWLADAYGEEAGFNLTLGTDLFAGPFTFSGEVDLGTLGDADLLHGRLTAALRQGDHFEWFAGYDYLDIGGTEIQGVVGGVRFRF